MEGGGVAGWRELAFNVWMYGRVRTCCSISGIQGKAGTRAVRFRSYWVMLTIPATSNIQLSRCIKPSTAQSKKESKQAAKYHA